jgi:hypothetical protein
MSRKTIGDVVSRIRNNLKSVNQDAFLTDRYIYSVVLKHGAWLMKREDGAFKLMKFQSIFQTLDFVELEEVDKITAQCTGLTSDCTIKRTKDKLPSFMEGYWGPLIRAVTSIDGSFKVEATTPNDYLRLSRQKNFKYNKTLYYWFINDYLYFPNLEWDAVRIEGIFEDDISAYTCLECGDDGCMPRQTQYCNIPEYLLGELETHVLQEMGQMMQFPVDPTHDKQNPSR